MVERAGKMAERANLRPVGVIENIELRLPPLRRGHRDLRGGRRLRRRGRSASRSWPRCRWSRSGAATPARRSWPPTPTRSRGWPSARRPGAWRSR